MSVSSPNRLAKSRRRSALVAASAGLFCAALFPSLAQAVEYEGAADHWGATRIAFSIDNGVLSGFAAQSTGRVDCATTTDADPTPKLTDIDPIHPAPQVTPVALANGSFSVQTSGEDNYGHALTVVAAGTVSGDFRRVEGTLTINGVFDAFGKHYFCHDVQPFLALEAPLDLAPNTKPTFAGSPVSFNFKGGRITKLTAIPTVECPDTSVINGDFNSTEYRYDPIHTDKQGRFELTASAFTPYGTVMEFSITGQVSGTKAKGKISATYENERNGAIEVCHGTTPWTAEVSSASQPSDAPVAYYAIGAYRFGRPGDYAYWFRVVLGGCDNANRVRVQVLGHGKAETVPCSGRISTAPLQPQRNYKIRITAMRTGGANGRTVLKQASVTESLYLPGPDGNFQEISR